MIEGRRRGALFFFLHELEQSRCDCKLKKQRFYLSPSLLTAQAEQGQQRQQHGERRWGPHHANLCQSDKRKKLKEGG